MERYTNFDYSYIPQSNPYSSMNYMDLLNLIKEKDNIINEKNIDIEVLDIRNEKITKKYNDLKDEVKHMNAMNMESYQKMGYENRRLNMINENLNYEIGVLTQKNYELENEIDKLKNENEIILTQLEAFKSSRNYGTNAAAAGGSKKRRSRK